MSVIDKDYAQKLGFKIEGQLNGHGTSNLAEFNFVEVDNFQIPGIYFKPQKMLAYKGLEKQFYEPAIIGILGYDFLSRFVSKIDYARQRLSFYHPDRFEYNGTGNIVNAPLQNKLFVIPVIINEKITGNYALDLGAFNTALNYSFAERNKLLGQKGIVRMSTDISGTLLEKQVKAKVIQIADYRIDFERFSFPMKVGKGSNSSDETAGFIGNNLLRHFNLYLDYKNQQLIFEKGENFNTVFPTDKSGMIIGRSISKQPEVVYVAENTPAAEIGIISGDIIVAINGSKENILSGIVNITKMLRGNDGDIINIRVRRGKENKDFKLVLRELL